MKAAKRLPYYRQFLKYYQATLGERCQTHILRAAKAHNHDNEGIRLQKLLARRASARAVNARKSSPMVALRSMAS